MLRSYFLAMVVGCCLSGAASAAPKCIQANSINKILEDLSYFYTLSARQSQIPPECYDKGLDLLSSISRSKNPLSDDDFRIIIRINIILDELDGESDMARIVDVIIHKDLKRFRPLFREFSDEISDRCTKINYVDHIEGMDCQVEHPYDPGEESAYCQKYHEKHRPSAELMKCRG